MSATIIDTNQCARSTLSNGHGDFAAIVDGDLCGAEDVSGMLRWIAEGQRFDAESLADTHQLIYMIEGDGVIELEGESYPVKQGAGVYLGPAETAGISHDGSVPLKLLHVVVPIKS